MKGGKEGRSQGKKKKEECCKTLQKCTVQLKSRVFRKKSAEWIMIAINCAYRHTRLHTLSVRSTREKNQEDRLYLSRDVHSRIQEEV